jgi:hypothetical protein
MKKSHIIFSIAFSAISTLLTLTAAPVVSAHSDCNASVDLQGHVSGNSAQATNYSTNPSCTYDATLAVYDSPKTPETEGWIEAQTLIGSKTVSVPAGQTVDITVEGTGSSCWNQADLIRGKDVLTPPTYSNAVAVDVYAVSCGSQISETPTPTPSCTPSVTETPTPTGETPTPGQENTPTPTPGSSGGSSSSSNNSSNSSSSNNSGGGSSSPSVTTLASTGNASSIYLIVLFGAAFLISGMVLKRFSK